MASAPPVAASSRARVWRRPGATTTASGVDARSRSVPSRSRKKAQSDSEPSMIAFASAVVAEMIFCITPKDHDFAAALGRRHCDTAIGGPRRALDASGGHVETGVPAPSCALRLCRHTTALTAQGSAGNPQGHFATAGSPRCGKDAAENTARCGPGGTSPHRAGAAEKGGKAGSAAWAIPARACLFHADPALGLAKHRDAAGHIQLLAVKLHPGLI